MAGSSTGTPEPAAGAVWRDDIDALSFTPAGHRGRCMMHRLAFRSFLGRAPSIADCLALFERQREAFEAAAAAKIAARPVAPDVNFHLTSREVAAWIDGQPTASITARMPVCVVMSL